MQFFELNKQFSFLYTYDISKGKLLKTSKGQGDFFTFNASFELMKKLLADWKSPIIMLSAKRENSPLKHPRLSVARYLCIGEFDTQNNNIKNIFSTENPLLFEDLINGGSALFCLSAYEDNSDFYEILIEGRGFHLNTPLKAKEYDNRIEVFSFD